MDHGVFEGIVQGRRHLARKTIDSFIHELLDLSASPAYHMMMIVRTECAFISRKPLSETITDNDAAQRQSLERVIHRRSRHLAVLASERNEDFIRIEMPVVFEHRVENFEPFGRDALLALL